jgi:hypothetical protein
MLAVSSALFAQSVGTDKPQDQSGVLDAHQIVKQSIAATERSWQARAHYTFMERDQDRRLDALGQLKSENIDVTRMILVNGIRFEQLIEHNGQLPSAEEQKKSDKDLEKLKHETPGDQSARLRKDQENQSYLRDLLEAFDFQLIGEENVGGRPAYVLQATPHPGYHAHGRYGKLFSRVQGKLWVDKQACSAVRTSFWSRLALATPSGCPNASKCAQAPPSSSSRASTSKESSPIPTIAPRRMARTP